MMLQPVGGDEGARRDDGAHREIDLSGNDDGSLAQGNDAYESGRQGDLLEIGALQKARLAHRHRRADDEEGQDETQFRDPQEASDQTARWAPRTKPSLARGIRSTR